MDFWPSSQFWFIMNSLLPPIKLVRHFTDVSTIFSISFGHIWIKQTGIIYIFTSSYGFSPNFVAIRRVEYYLWKTNVFIFDRKFFIWHFNAEHTEYSKRNEKPKMIMPQLHKLHVLWPKPIEYVVSSHVSINLQLARRYPYDTVNIFRIFRGRLWDICFQLIVSTIWGLGSHKNAT